MHIELDPYRPSAVAPCRRDSARLHKPHLPPLVRHQGDKPGIWTEPGESLSEAGTEVSTEVHHSVGSCRAIESVARPLLGTFFLVK